MPASPSPASRTAQVERKTRETHIRLKLDLGGGPASIETGVGFFDHMLDHLARHSRFGLELRAEGDTHVDDHHTVEDVGIALGEALLQALADKKGIERHGDASVPMDEALVRVTIDLSGRFAFEDDGPFVRGVGRIGDFDGELVPEFLKAFAQAGKFNLHVETVRGQNLHHIAEATFKALGRTLRQAAAITGDEIPSTKGVL